MLSRRLAIRAAIGSLALGSGAFVFDAGNPAFAGPPGHGGGGGFGAGDWINFGIGAANAINRAQQQEQYQQQQQYPQYQQPQYVPQPVAPQVNVIPEKKVEPVKNAVPLKDKILPLRKREAKCYLYGLSDNIGKARDTADAAWKDHKKVIGDQIAKSLAKAGADEATLKAVTELLKNGDFEKAREQVDGLKLSKEAQDVFVNRLDASQRIDQQMADLQKRMEDELVWKETQKSLESIAAAITQLSQQAAVNPRTPPRMDRVVTGIGELANLLIIRDILVEAANTNGPTRFTPINGAQIPRGIVRVIYDPDLPVGTGLLVNETTMIAGSGGRGELQTGIASAAEALGLPVAPGVPVADLGKDENPPKGGILITNPEDNSGTIKYVLASAHSYELKNGYRQLLPGDQKWLIEFDRGGSYGSARYTLAEGIYDFKVGNKGWDMVSRPLKAVIDNSDGVDDFHYVQDNERKVVKAGESLTIENKSPVVISFDRGGEAASRKLLNKSGTYKVAVNIESNRYDLFAPVEPEKQPKVEAVAGSGD